MQKKWLAVYGRRGSKPQKGGPGWEVVRDNLSNKKQRNITKYKFFGKSSDGNFLANGVYSIS